MFRAFYVGTTQTKTLTLNSIVMVLSNVLFNWILIFGNLGMPALGITGAAIGSSLAEGVSLIFFVIYTKCKCDRPKFGLDKAAGFELAELKGMMPICTWTMIQGVVSLSTWFIFFVYIEHLGERALAISNIARSISGLFWMVLAAFSSTCSTLVSNIIGEGRQDKVISIVKRILKLTYGIIICMTIVCAIFPRAVIRIYTDIPDLIEATVPSMSGTGSTKTAFRLEIVALTIYICYCTVVIMMLRSDIAICWTSEHVYSLSVLLLSWFYLKSGRWKNRKV